MPPQLPPGEYDYALDPEQGTEFYQCPTCHQKFPVSYERVQPSWKKDYGIKQYLRLAAQSNFRRHKKACLRKRVEEAGDVVR